MTFSRGTTSLQRLEHLKIPIHSTSLASATALSLMYRRLLNSQGALTREPEVLLYCTQER